MPASFTARHYVNLKTQAGVVVAKFDNWQSLEYGMTVNDTFYYTLSFANTGDSRFNLFELDGQIEIWRSVPGMGVGWYKEFEGFHRRETWLTEKDGAQMFVSSGVGYNDLLARTCVAYPAGTSQADKDTAAETAMKEYVLENCGVLATSTDRYFCTDPTDDTCADSVAVPGVLPNFGVETDEGNGATWEGCRGYENLLDVLKDIANFSAIDFQVVGTDPASFEFRTYVNQLGTDRTQGNTADNQPVIFSVPLGNIQRIQYELDRTAEVNVVLVLGKGEKTDRQVVPRRNDAATDDSPWNRREASRPGTNQEFVNDLEVLGDEHLEELQAKETFSFAPLRQPSSVYGKHYFLGDKVTARYNDVVRDKRIISVKNRITNVGELLTFEFADIPKTP